MRNQYVLILLAALAPVFAGTVQFEAGESSMSPTTVKPSRHRL